MSTPELTPVIVGVGECVDRGREPSEALEPLALMAEALRTADLDGAGGWLARLDCVEVVALTSWRYADPVGQLCERLGLDPARKLNTSRGGETPIRLIHDAALRIASGESLACAIVGGEATNSRDRARKANATLDWTPMAAPEEAARFPGPAPIESPIAQQLGMLEPARIYPLYEMATQAAWGQTPAEGEQDSAALWSKYAAVAAENPAAWIRSKPDARTIRTVSPENRMINWPYPKFMVANPSVNQAAAIIVTSLAKARAAGVPETRLVHIWGGAAASEPESYLERDGFDHSKAQAAVLARAVELAGGAAENFGHLELYSCFPVVPKMALRALGLRMDDRSPTVTGGLSFFGGPLHNYMSHAACSMVRALRAAPGTLGLLYGQGGYVTKHHALVVSGRAPETPLARDYSVQSLAGAARGAIPPMLDGFSGEATVETYTVQFARDGEPTQGVVVLRTPSGARTMASVPPEDTESLALLLATERNAIGVKGTVRLDAAGRPIWAAAPEG